VFLSRGRALDGVNRANARHTNQTPNTGKLSMAVRLWGLSSMVERETAQIVV
jgi:hypothetical protein